MATSLATGGAGVSGAARDQPARSTGLFTRAPRWIAPVAISLALLANVAFWTRTGVSVGAVVKTLAWWTWCVHLPGWLLTRAVRGRSRILVAELSLAAGVGVVTSTVAWLLLVALGLPSVHLLWPLLTGLSLAWRAPRRRVLDLSRYPARMGVLTALGFAFLVVEVGARLATAVYAPSALPPGPLSWYPDSMWHLSIVEALTHGVPPLDLNVASGPLWYHWFSDAFVAALSVGTGLDTTLALVRLWQPLVAITVLGLLLVAAERLTGRLWPGVVAGFVGYSRASAFVWFSLPGLQSMMVPLSPSHQWALVPMLLSVIGVAEVLRSRRRAAPIALCTLGTAGMLGGKSSSLPVVICGLALLMLVLLVRDRSRLVPVATMLGISLAGFAFSVLTTTPGNHAGSLLLAASVRRTVPWQLFLNGAPSVDPDAHVIAGLDRPGGVVLLALVLATFVVASASALLALPHLRRMDPAAWFLFGVGSAGFCATMLVLTAGESQQYFMRGALPAWALLAALGAHGAWSHARRSLTAPTAVLVAVLSASAGWLCSDAIRLRGEALVTGDASIRHAVGGPLALYVVALCLVSLTARALRREARWLVLAGFVLGGQRFGFGDEANFVDPSRILTPAAIVSGLVAVALLLLARRHAAGVRRVVGAGTVATLVVASALQVLAVADLHTSRPAPGSGVLTADEVAGARWMRAHLDRDALVATNVHCAHAPETDRCWYTGFWPAGLSGRRTFIGAWAYTSEGRAAARDETLHTSRHPFHDAERFRLNQLAFTEPTAARLDELRALGVTHLFADRRHTAVSPALDELATVRFRNRDVVVYELP